MPQNIRDLIRNVLFFQILRWSNKPSKEEIKLTEEKTMLKHEQNQMSITENFAKHSKLQRKINIIDEKINELRNDRNNMTFHFSVIYGLKLFIGILVLLSSIYFRNIPVFHVDERISLMPFNHIISFPNEKNSVSFHFWILCCSAVARLIKL